MSPRRLPPPTPSSRYISMPAVQDPDTYYRHEPYVLPARFRKTQIGTRARNNVAKKPQYPRAFNTTFNIRERNYLNDAAAEEYRPRGPCTDVEVVEFSQHLPRVAFPKNMLHRARHAPSGQFISASNTGIAAYTLMSSMATPNLESFIAVAHAWHAPVATSTCAAVSTPRFPRTRTSRTPRTSTGPGSSSA